VPITGRKPGECFRTFRDHLGPVVAAALGDQHQVICRNDGNKSSLTLGPPNSAAGVKLTGSRGSFWFSLRQNLEVLRTDDKKRWQLKTREYRYAISESNDEMTEALMRWDYVCNVPPIWTPTWRRWEASSKSARASRIARSYRSWGPGLF
jgi:hypothetical protein